MVAEASSLLVVVGGHLVVTGGPIGCQHDATEFTNGGMLPAHPAPLRTSNKL